MEFSHKTRAHNIDRIQSQTFDILVIGGGISGAGVARDAALRGFSVALLEKGDFASGTSGKSARFVHGGFRYLAQLQLGLVLSACAERHQLRKLAPRIVRPADFVFPVFRRDKNGLAKINLGMWLYEFLALFRTPRRHRIMPPEEVQASEPAILQEGLDGAVNYYDCLADDVRLTLATIKAAHAQGALVSNYLEVIDLIKDKGKVVGVKARDSLAGQSLTVHGLVVANATGPWVDKIRQIDVPEAERRLRANRGSHISVARERMPINNVVIFAGADGERFMYAVPWGGTVIIGTTDVDHHGDLDTVFATTEEVESMLTSVNRVFPNARLTVNDVLSTFAGLRPLMGGDEVAAYQASRDHEIIESPSGLVSIVGGKLTTYRKMAEDMVDHIARKLAKEGRTLMVKTGESATSPIEALNHDPGLEILNLQARFPKHSRDVLSYLANTYGLGAEAILSSAEGHASLAQRLDPERPYLYAEIPYAVQYEMAMTLSDCFIRRMHIIHETKDQGIGAARAAATIMGHYLDWDADDLERNIEAYRDQVKISNMFRSPHPENSL